MVDWAQSTNYLTFDRASNAYFFGSVPFNKKETKIPTWILSIGTLISAFEGSHHRLSEQKRRRIRSIRIPFSVERSVLKKKGQKGNEEKEERKKGQTLQNFNLTMNDA